MPNIKTVSVAAAVSLALFVAFVWWDGKAAKPPMPPSEVAIAAPKIQAHTGPRGPESGVEAISAKPPEKPRDSADLPSASEAPPALPVLVHFYRRLRDPDRRIEGSIENTSDENLSITLNVLSARTGTQSRSVLEVPSQSRIVFGRDDGLILEAADQITLQSQMYGDLVQEIH